MYWRPGFWLAAGGLLVCRAAYGDWPMYGGDPQHTAISAVAAQSLDQIRFQTPVDLDPQYQNNDLFIHYGSPLITPLNTLLVPMKTGADSGFQIQAFNAFNPAAAATPAPLWTLPTDYILPPHAWVTSYSPALTSSNRLYFAGAGGVVNWVSNVDDAVTPTVHQVAFYNHTAADDSSVFINTPLTADAQGDVYFGVQVTQGNPNVQSSLVRLGADGSVHTFNVAAELPGYTNVAQNCAPAISRDGSTLYVAVNNGDGTSFLNNGVLAALDAQTLALKSQTELLDPITGAHAFVPDMASTSPTIGPDGDVYFGVAENPYPENNGRGWLLHFSADLATVKTPGAFGWDDTTSVVPSAAVPSYTGPSTYLLMTKYNNYEGIGTGDGQNKIAILDPSTMQTDPITGAPVMKEVLTQLGVDEEGEIAEWCINNAAVDPATKSVLANSEDGVLYRWDLTTNTLAQSLRLTDGRGEAYTPTVIGPDGTVYAINDAKLFAAGSAAISQIDLGTGTLVLHGVSVAAVTARLHDGYNEAGVLWNGPGLISSAARTTPGMAIGVVSGAQYQALYPGASFGSQPILSTDVILMYTFAGDATMDGRLTVADYAQIDAGFLLGGDDLSWVNGDFNYDGVVDYRDYAIIDANFAQLYGVEAQAMIAAHWAEFGAPYLAALENLDPSAVPEPATLTALLPGLCFLAVRRRKAA